jgi:hypothetical protein
MTTRLASRLAIVGSGIGILAALGLGALRLGLIRIQPDTSGVPTPPFNGELLGGLAFALAYLFPFGLSFYVLRRSSAEQAAVWLGTAAMAILAAFTSFSLVTLILFPVPALLAVAGVLAARAAGWRNLPAPLAIALLLSGVGVAAWRILFLREDGMCWDLLRGANGAADYWQARAFSFSGTISANSGPGQIITSTCSSDIISPLEAGLSTGLWMLAVVGLRWWWARSAAPHDLA